MAPNIAPKTELDSSLQSSGMWHDDDCVLLHEPCSSVFTHAQRPDQGATDLGGSHGVLLAVRHSEGASNISKTMVTSSYYKYIIIYVKYNIRMILVISVGLHISPRHLPPLAECVFTPGTARLD